MVIESLPPPAVITSLGVLLLPIIAMARMKQAEKPKLPPPPKERFDLIVDQAYGLVYYPNGRTKPVRAVKYLLRKLGKIVFPGTPNQD